jgi:hypothetical protein
MKNVSPAKGEHQFTSTLERSDNKLWGCHFRVPAPIAKQLVDGESRRVVCTLNNRAEYQCAILTVGRGARVITVNKKLRDSLGLAFGMEVHVRLKKDTSEYGLPLPEELQELLRQDAEGNRVFHALTRGRQRTLLYIVNSAKNPEKRIARAIVIIKHLKANNGRINYKQLNAMLKEPRR